ncbi:energy transducer TonB [Erythrobacter sp. MTPC3]|uniref:energy transducer TonB n=1 Tax=Erythrobacter sp. MTPC3 TaxID=3056564 RepID=UPI0036F28843
MSYANTANKASPAALLGALGVPAAFGAVLVLGLAVKVTMPDRIENPDTFDVKPIEPDVPPPPPKPTQEQTAETPAVTPTFQAPIDPPFDFDFTPGPSKPIDQLPGLDTGVIGPVEIPGNGLGIEPAPTLPNPVSASPRGNPGRWVTDNDYRSNWIRRGMSGVAGFTLSIDEKGRVSDCAITRSTGHEQLDAATCKLIENRARFDAAKDSYGKPVAGTYRNSVNWKLPE